MATMNSYKPTGMPANHKHPAQVSQLAGDIAAKLFALSHLDAISMQQGIPMSGMG